MRQPNPINYVTVNRDEARGELPHTANIAQIVPVKGQSANLVTLSYRRRDWRLLRNLLEAQGFDNLFAGVVEWTTPTRTKWSGAGDDVQRLDVSDVMAWGDRHDCEFADMLDDVARVMREAGYPSATASELLNAHGDEYKALQRLVVDLLVDFQMRTA